MGQKIHPYGLRLGIVTDWKSRWYSKKDYADQVVEDAKIRDYLRAELVRGAVSRIEVERIGDKKVQIDVHTARPGVVIGRSGSEAERLRSYLEKMTERRVKFNVIEVKDPETDAQLLARGVADQLQGRVSFRRAMKRAVATAMKAGAQGVKVQCSGRLGGRRHGPSRVVSRGPCSATHPACGHRLRRRHRQDHRRCDRRQGLGLQG